MGSLLLLFSGGWLNLPLAQAAPPVSAENLQQLQQKLEQHRTGVSKQGKQLQQLQVAAQSRLNGLQQIVKATDAQIKANEDQISLATQQLSNLETNLATTQKSYQKKQAATAARLRFLQRRRTTNGWASLLQSQTLEDFLDRRHQLKLVYQADQRVLVGLKTEGEQIDFQRTQVETQKNNIALLTQQLLAQQADYTAQAQLQGKLVNRLNTDQQAMEAAEVRLATDSKNIGSLIQRQLQRTDLNRIVIFGTGQMSYPSNGPITSSFGWRLHPVLGYGRFHSGMDFGAAYGAPIRAADRGTVIFVGWYGGYGNAVIIDHGNGVTSLYGHSSQLYVTEGQVIQRGQAIAAVGSTGLSTGPHLHFEVRQNGAPIDPLAYL